MHGKLPIKTIMAVTKKEFKEFSHFEKIEFLKRNLCNLNKYSSLCDFSYAEWEEILSNFPVCTLRSMNISTCNNTLKIAKIVLEGRMHESDTCDFSFSDWEYLLSRRPEFKETACNYPDGTVIALLKTPSLKDNFSGWIRLKASHWNQLIKRDSKFKEFAEKYPQGRTALFNKNFGESGTILQDDGNIYNWQALAILCPWTKKRYKNWDTIPVKQWIQILTSYPEFSLHFDKWEKLSYIEWVNILSIFESKEYFINIAKNYHSGWAGILCLNPELITRCNIIDDLTPADWIGILRFEPKLIKYCKKYKDIPFEGFIELFEHYAGMIDMSMENLKIWDKVNNDL